MRMYELEANQVSGRDLSCRELLAVDPEMNCQGRVGCEGAEEFSPDVGITPICLVDPDDDLKAKKVIWRKKVLSRRLLSLRGQESLEIS